MSLLIHLPHHQSQIGRREKVSKDLTHRINTSRKFGEADHYIHARLDGEDYLFTHGELSGPRARARRQPEDVPTHKTLLQRILGVFTWRR